MAAAGAGAGAASEGSNAPAAPAALAAPASGADELFDIAVVGGGPAGLQAALKGALMGQRAVLFDKGRKYSRVWFAPRLANIPALAQAPRGSQLIRQGYAALERANAELGGLVTVHERTEVVNAEYIDIAAGAIPAGATPAREGRGGQGNTGAAHEAGGNPEGSITGQSSEGGGGHFLLTHTGAVEGQTRARVLVLATGVVDRQPWVGPEERNIQPILPYANRGLVDYCLLCDGHTVAGKKVAVIGADPSAVSIGESLRETWGAEITLVACPTCVSGDSDPYGQEREAILAKAAKAGFPVLDIHIMAMEGLREGQVVLVDPEGKRHRFDKAFLTFGWYKVNSELAVALGGATAWDGTLYTDEECQVLRSKGGEPVGGLYAIGDIRHETWNQIPSAWADAETAVIHAWATHL